MNAEISIRPSKDLRNNYAQISLLSREHPVAITVNGKEDTIVMCHDDYINREKLISELEARLMVYDHLAQAADDMKLGRIQGLDEAFDDILMELEQVQG